MRARGFALGLLLALAAAACGDDSASGPSDPVGPAGRRDAATEPAPGDDAGAPDAGGDAGADAAVTDADAGSDAGADAAVADAGSDAASDAGSDAGPATCASLTCGANATCDDSTGTAACDCDPGHQDNDGDGDCSPDCSTLTCGANATCDDSTGSAGCGCDAGHQDNDGDGDCSPNCATACGDNTTCDDADGTASCACVLLYQDNDGDGDCSPSCANWPCGQNTACDDESGTATCSCVADHQDNDGDGDCSPDCSTLTCGANATCDDSGGLAACGCDAGHQDNDGDGDCSPDCPSTSCGVNTACDDRDGTAACSCLPGHWDEDGSPGCEACLPGYQDLDGDGACLPDCSNGHCNGGASCDVSSGAAVCSCTPSPSCDPCQSGYQDNDGDGTCVEDCSRFECNPGSTCSDGSGAPVCNCDAGYQDNDGDGQCRPGCSLLACGQDATCSDQDGTARCLCDAGHQDNDGNGSCLPDCASAQAAGLACGDNASCDDGAGTAECICWPGYQDGDGDGDCAINCATAVSLDLITCGEHAACSDAGGSAECACDEGYATLQSPVPAEGCLECAAGYQDNDGDDACAIACNAISCPQGASCADSAGPASCSCDPGLSLCYGQCVDTQTDAAHCGACGNPCPIGECNGGSCGCPGATQECGGECVDQTTDARFCGGCGTSCASAQSCVGSVCQAVVAESTLEGNVSWLRWTTMEGPGGGGVGSATTGPLEAAEVRITPAVVVPAISDSVGDYSADVENGDYVLRPSYPPGSARFNPYERMVSVTDELSSGNDFVAELAYQVSGVVHFDAAASGRLWIQIGPDSCGGCDLAAGTSVEVDLSVAGDVPFAVRGVPPGGYGLRVFLDTAGSALRFASTPAAETRIEVIDQDVALPSPLSLSPGPSGTLEQPVWRGAVSGDGVIALGWDSSAVEDNSLPVTESYDLYYGSSAGVSPASHDGSVLSISAGAGNVSFTHSGLTNGDDYYYVVVPHAGGSSGPVSEVLGPVTVGPPAGGATVSGTIDFSGGTPSAEALYVALIAGESLAYVSGRQVVSGPAAFQIPGVAPGNYLLVAVLDRDDDGLFDDGDLISFATGDVPPVQVGATDVSINYTFTLTDVGIFIETDYEGWVNPDTAMLEGGYRLHAEIHGGLARVVSATVIDGKGVYLPADLPKRDFGSELRLEGAALYEAPQLGDAYTFEITLDDGSTLVRSATVNDVLGPAELPAPLTPAAGALLSCGTQPTSFGWGATPIDPSSFTYEVSAYVQSFSGPPYELFRSGELPGSTTGHSFGPPGGDPPDCPSSQYWQLQMRRFRGPRARMSVPYALTPCAGVACQDNANCIAQPAPVCVCDAGYQDNDGNDTCEPDCGATDCGVNTVCDDTGGTALCDCAPGYVIPAAGSECIDCDAGYQDNDGNDSCLVDCTLAPCGAQALCDDAGGVALCTCDGVLGPCEVCAADYQDNDDDGVCALDCNAAGLGCDDGNLCDDSTGVAQCVCRPEYQDNDGDGLCYPACASWDCGPGASCDDESGYPVCSCDAGYQDNDRNDLCEPDCSQAHCSVEASCDDGSGTALCDCTAPCVTTCEAGYQDNDGDGVCRGDCSAVTCVTDASCDDASGFAVCSCDPGFTRCGAECVDLTSDPDHCGSCNAFCELDACSGGVCGCAGQNLQCGFPCVSPSSNADHCDGCDQPCGVGEQCVASVCTAFVGDSTLSGLVFDSLAAAPLEGAVVSIDPPVVASVTTASDGLFVFDVPNGTYTLTPSYPPGSAQFWPGQIEVTVSNEALGGNDFFAERGFTVSGTVSYMGLPGPGRVWLGVFEPGCTGCIPRAGTSTTVDPDGAVDGPFAIWGVPDGSYTLGAFYHPDGEPYRYAHSPSAEMPLDVSGSDTVVGPVSLASPGSPGALISWGRVISGPGLRVVHFDVARDGGGLPTVDRFDLRWGTPGSLPGNPDGSVLGAAPRGPVGIQIVDGIAAPDPLEYQVVPYADATPGDVMTLYAQGQPAGHDVQGTLFFSGFDPGGADLVVLLEGQSGYSVASGLYALPTPSTSLAYAVPDVPPGEYRLRVLIDLDGDGTIEASDLTTFSDRDPTRLTMVQSDLGGVDYTVAMSSVRVELSPGFSRFLDGGAPSDSYSMALDIESELKRAVGVTLLEGPGVFLPWSLGLNSGAAQGRLSTWFWPPDPPAPGQLYRFLIDYDDASQETVAAAIGMVLGPDQLPTPLSPAPGADLMACVQPTMYGWSTPVAPLPEFVYEVWVDQFELNDDWAGQVFGAGQLSSDATGIDFSGVPPGSALVCPGKQVWSVRVRDVPGFSGSASIAAEYLISPP